ncbi:MAG: hypothetical protein WCO98_14475, partial [bacterium]
MIFLKDYILKLSRPALILLCWVFLFATNAVAQNVISYPPGLDYVRVVELSEKDIFSGKAPDNLMEALLRVSTSNDLPASLHLTGVERGEGIKVISPDELVKYECDKIMFCEIKTMSYFSLRQLAAIRCAVADGDWLIINFSGMYGDDILKVKIFPDLPIFNTARFDKNAALIFPDDHFGIKDSLKQLDNNLGFYTTNSMPQFMQTEFINGNKAAVWSCKYGKGRIIIDGLGIKYENFIKAYNKGIDKEYFSLFPLYRKSELSMKGDFERYPGGMVNEDGEKSYGYKNENSLIVNEKVPVEIKTNAQIYQAILPALKGKYTRNITTDLLVQTDDKVISATLLSPFIEGEYEQKYPEPGKELWRIKQDGVKSFVVQDNLLFTADAKCAVNIFDVITGNAVLSLPGIVDRYELIGNLAVVPLRLNVAENMQDIAMTVIIPCRDKQSGSAGLLAILPGFKLNILPPQMPIEKLPEDFTVTDAKDAKVTGSNLNDYFTSVIPAGNTLTGLFNSWQMYSSGKIKLPLKIAYKNEMLGSMNLFPVKNPVFNDIGNTLQYFIQVPGEKVDGEITSIGSEIYLSNDKGMIYAVDCTDILSKMPISKPVAIINDKISKWQIKDRKVSFTTTKDDKFKISDNDNNLRVMVKIGEIADKFTQITDIVDNVMPKDIIGKRVALKKDEKFFDAGKVLEFTKTVIKLSAKEIPIEFAGAEVWINSDDIAVTNGEILINPGELDADKSPLKLTTLNGENIPWYTDKNGKVELNYTIAGNTGAVQVSDDLQIKYYGQILKVKYYKNVAEKPSIIEVLAYLPDNLKQLPKDLKPFTPPFFAADSRRIVHFNQFGKSDYQLNGYYHDKSYDFGYINNMQVLHNGNLLVCDTGKSKVVEITRDGSFVWSYPDVTLDKIDTNDGKNIELPDESFLKINAPRDARRYEIKKQMDEVKITIEGKVISLGKAEITWQSTLIADTDNFRVIEVIRPFVKLFRSSFNDDKLKMTEGSYYRPYCYYEFKGEKRYLRQTAAVIADGKSLGLKKPLTFLTAYRYSDDATLPDDDIIISGVRTKTLLTANNLPVDAPDVKDKKLRVFILKRENAEKQMNLAVNPYNNQYDFLPDGVETNSIRHIF